MSKSSKQRNKEWRERNPEVSKERCRVYKEANRNKERKRAREHNAKRRRMLDAIKQETGCMDCTYNEHPVALDFDHVRGKKLFQISAKVTKTWESLMEEIAKCEVVCANCHRIRTFNRKSELQTRSLTCK